MTFRKIVRVAVVPLDGLVYLNKLDDRNYEIIGGPEGELVKLCAHALKFPYKVLLAPDKVWGNYVNGTWTGAIGMVYRNEADIGISKFGMSLLRSQYIQYSYPYIIELFTFGTRQPGLRTHVDAIIQPFSPILWLAIIVTVIILSLLFAFLQHISVVESVQKLFEILIAHSTKIKYDNMQADLFLSAWIIGSLFLSYSYVAVLLSFLTIPTLEKIPENIEELAEAVQAGTYNAMTFKGTMVLSGFRDNERKAIRIIAKHIEEKNNFVEHKRQVILESMQREKVALISPDNALKLLLQHNFFMSNDFFKIHATAIIVSKSFCCKDQIDDFVHRISASGMYRKHLEDEIFLQGLKSRHLNIDLSVTEKAERSLSLMDISGAFALIFTGHMLAIIVAGAEIVCFKIFENKTSKFVSL